MAERYGNNNALKHGAFTDVVILPGEDPNELKELRAALHEEWNPEGPTEIDKVESIAMNMWRKRRFQRYVQRTLGKSVGIGNAFLQKDRRDYDRLVNALEQIETGTVTEENFADKLPKKWADAIAKKAPRNQYDDDPAWLAAVSEIIHGILNSLISSQDQTKTCSYEMAIDVFADSEQTFIERIDAKIDKDIKALGQIKTMKAIGIGQRHREPTNPTKPIEISPLRMVEGE